MIYILSMLSVRKKRYQKNSKNLYLKTIKDDLHLLKKTIENLNIFNKLGYYRILVIPDYNSG